MEVACENEMKHHKKESLFRFLEDLICKMLEVGV